MNAWGARRLARSTPGATDGLVKAVVEKRSRLSGNATSFKALYEELMTSGHLAEDDGPLVRRFLAILHDELSRREPVLWQRPASGAARDVLPGVLGRQAELDSITARISRHENVVVRGSPGIGKTTLLDALRHAYPEAAYVRLEQGGQPMRDLRLALHSHVSGDFPVDDDQGIALLVRALPHGTILLADNADEPDSAAAVLRLVTHISSLVVVVTSRAQAFPGFHPLEVPPLDRRDALALLEEFDLQADKAERVIERGGGNPLLLRQEAWASQEGVPDEDPRDRLESVLRRFSADDERLLWIIGELPAASLPTALLTDVGRMTSSSFELLRRNAVAKRAPGALIEFHQTLRAASEALLNTVPRPQIALLRREATEYYVRWLGTDPALEDVDVAFPNLIHLLRTVDQATLRVDLALALIGDRLDDPAGYLPSRGLTGLFREQRDLLQTAAADVGGAKAGQLEKNLGLFCHWGDDPIAEELVLSSRSRFRDAGDRVGEAASTWVLGIIADDSGLYQDAEALYRAPLRWLHDPAIRAVGHHLVGCSLYHQSRFDEARTAFEAARRESTDAVVRSRSDRRIAYVDLLAGKTEEAIQTLEEIKRRAEELNRPRDVARTARHLGIGRLALDQVSLAEAEFLVAQDLFLRVGDRRGQGATLLGLATTRRLQARFEEARELVRESRDIAAGGNDLPTSRMVSPVGVARAEEEDAAIAQAEGRHEAATVYRRRACNIYEAIGHQRAAVLAGELGAARDAAFPSKPNAIVFDLVDTLAETRKTEYEDAKRRISEALGVDHERFKAVWARSRYQASLEASWSPQDRIRWTAEQLGADVDDDTLVELGESERELWSSSVYLKSDALPIIERLRSRGLHLGLVSNGTSAMRGLPQALGISEWFSAVVISCEVGALKPHRAIYERAVQLMELSPSECLYVGDGSDRELEGAKAVGMFAVRMLAPKPRYSSQNSLDWDATVASLPELAERLGV